MEVPMRNLSELFKALSDETRLQMLALLLRRGELCVCDFVEALGITQSKVSRHLRYLAHAGLVRDRREAVWVYYRVRPDPEADPAAVLDAIGPLLAGRDLAELERRLQAFSCVPATRRAG
jgi:ArsR family transcriptional regulator